MAKQKLEVLESEHKSGVKNGKPWAMTVCQCVLTGADGKKVVGEVTLPRGHAEVPAGEYLVETELGKNFEGKIQGQIVSLVPYGVRAMPMAGAKV